MIHVTIDQPLSNRNTSGETLSTVSLHPSLSNDIRFLLLLLLRLLFPWNLPFKTNILQLFTYRVRRDIRRDIIGNS